MSRIGNQPVILPSAVTVKLDGSKCVVTGPKGELETAIPELITVSEASGSITVNRRDDSQTAKAQHGLIRSLIQNLVIGVTEGYEKKLIVEGVGFKSQVTGSKLVLSLGYSHDVEYEIPNGITVTADNNTVTVSGIDKQQVGQVAAEIRALRKPEPYKGKGIRYDGEYIIRKAGKAAAGKE
jgi:large subunit ribosomal protein L6